MDGRVVASDPGEASRRHDGRSRSGRARHAWRLVIALLVGTALLNSGMPVAGAVDPGAAEREFLTLLNRTRVEAGLPALPRDGRLDGVARDWSGTMMAQDRLYHRPNLVEEVDRRVTTNWTRIGENVGVGGSVQTLHDAFMASPGHRNNVLGAYNSVGVGVVTEGDGTIWVTFNFMNGAATPGPTGLERPPSGDVRLVSGDGGVFTFGAASYAGSLGGRRLGAPIVGAAPTPTGGGYWLVGRDGGVFSFGDARFFGSTGGFRLNQPVVGVVPTTSGRGYWLVARDGGMFSFGDARFFGSTGAIQLREPITGAAPSPTGQGYWLVARDGGVFAFGDAVFHGSMGGSRIGGAIVGMTATPSGRGYWLAGADGSVFTFGDAGFFGSLGGRANPSPITQIAATKSGQGYYLVASDGRVYAFGDAGSGASDPIHATAAIVDIDAA